MKQIWTIKISVTYVCNIFLISHHLGQSFYCVRIVADFQIHFCGARYDGFSGHSKKISRHSEEIHKSFSMLAGKRISEESSCLYHLDSRSMTSDNSKDFSMWSFDCVCFLFRLFKTFKLLSKCIIMHYSNKNCDDRASLKECLTILF